MTVNELYRHLDEAYPVTLREEWDNDGLMLSPDGTSAVKRVLLTLDVTEAAADYAIANGYDCIVSHHPLIFRPLSSLTTENAVTRKCLKLLKSGVSVFSFHTRLDTVAGGVNDALAEKFGLSEVAPFGENRMGRIGNLSFSMTAEQFASFVKKALAADGVLLASAGREVRRVAVLGGDGKSGVAEAFAAGADTFVSGRIGYNIMAEARENGMNLVEAGHYFTEAPVLAYLEKRIRSFIPEAEIGYFTSNNLKLL